MDFYFPCEKVRNFENEDRNIKGLQKKAEAIYTWIFLKIINRLMQGQ